MSTTNINININSNNNQTLIFVYGTLKQGFPNHHLLQHSIASNDAVFMGRYRTLNPYPLVCGPLGIPFLLNIPGPGHRVRGELYRVSGRALARLDELEGIDRGHYERLPVEVAALTAAEEEEGGPRVTVAAEGYFGHNSFGEEMWRKSGMVGMEEYLDKDGEKYVRVENRDVGLYLRIQAFLQSNHDDHDNQLS